MANEIDIEEGDIAKFENGKILEILLRDQTTQKNILWATDCYAQRGEGYTATDEITAAAILSDRIIVPRVMKAREEQAGRTKKMAEVFTPARLCKEMNDALEKAVDEDGYADDWRGKICKTVLEISCGEAPFLVTRYDATTACELPIAERVGILDRKLRLVSEHTRTSKSWIKHALSAYRSTYGYEWQGDSLLLAREAMFYSFLDYHKAKFGEEPPSEALLKVAEIISWNLWQMDGLKYVVPNSCHPEIEQAEEPEQLDLFITSAPAAPKPKQLTLACPGCFENNDMKHNGIYCKIINWTFREHRLFKDVVSGKEDRMKYDYVIGNPPYQEDCEDTSDKPIYNEFMDRAYQEGEKVLLVTPARFLFNAGKTPKAWNEKMLADKHLKVLKFEQNSAKFFANTNIKGGIAITYRDAKADFGAIGCFTAFPELNSILRKVKAHPSFATFCDIIYPQDKFNLDALYSDYPHYKELVGSDGRERRLTTSIFSLLDVFSEIPHDGTENAKILGLIKNNRVFRFIPTKYLDESNTFKKYKVLIPKSNGSGSIGEVLSTPLIGEPLIGEPLIGVTQSFIQIGTFETKREAEHALKYVKTRFARTMLGVLKITQDNSKDTWRYVPMQDFTSKSDIDWSKSVGEIDRLLYAKYALDEAEIAFIESKVRAME